MSQISKCPNVTVVLTYWEPSGEVSELRYKSLLYCSSKRSYCIMCLDCDTCDTVISKQDLTNLMKQKYIHDKMDIGTRILNI